MSIAFECFECCQFFQNSIGFTCHHYFCKECYEKTSSGTEYSNSEICPKCKKDEESQTNNVKFSCGIAGSVLQNVPGDDNYDEICECCDEGSRIIGKCVVCQDKLCKNCVSAHKRVTLTKRHAIYLFENQVFHESNPTNRSSNQFSEHDPMSYCVVCKKQPSQNCFLNKHKVVLNRNMMDYQNIRRENELEIMSEYKNMSKDISNIDKITNDIKLVIRKIDSTKKDVARKIERYFENCKKELDKRTEELLKQLERMKTTKEIALRKHSEYLNCKKRKMVNLIRTIENPAERVNIMNDTHYRNDILRKINDLKIKPNDLQIREDAGFSFIPDDTLITEIRNLCALSNNAHIPIFEDLNLR